MKKYLSLLTAVFLLLTFSSCSTEKKITRQSFAFDTVITITADKNASPEITKAFELCKGYENIFSKTKSSSELYSINRGKVSSPSKDIMQVLSFSLKMSALTDGAFDVTIAPLTDLWNVKDRSVPPTESEIKAAQNKVGYGRISLQPFSLSGTALDMGGVAKGYIADELIEHFKKNNINDVTIDLGGNVAVLGEHTVGIRNPFNPDEIFAVMRLKDKSAVTSGAYQRYFEYDGKRYHHIIDPRTGKCVESGIASVTVISPCSMWADALSTSIYILGENALSLCSEFPDTDAIIITDDNKVITTENFEEKYHLEYN